MKATFIASATALVMMTGGAFAQTTTTESTTVTQPAPVMAPAPVAPPPAGTLSTTETQKSVDGYGNSYSSTKTSYGTADGAYSQSSSSTTEQQGGAMPAVVTTKKTTTTTTSP